jgi:hypothetical protein
MIGRAKSLSPCILSFRSYVYPMKTKPWQDRRDSIPENLQLSLVDTDAILQGSHPRIVCSAGVDPVKDPRSR